MKPSEEQGINITPEIEEEINLIDLMRVIAKRKVLILGGAILCLAVAVAVTPALPTKYKVSFVVDVGMIQAGGEYDSH